MNSPVYRLTLDIDPAITQWLQIVAIISMLATLMAMCGLLGILYHLRRNNILIDKSNDLLDEIADLLCDDPDDKDEEDIPMPESNIVPMHHYRGVWGIPPHGTCHEAVACDRTPQEPSVGAPPAAYRHRITHERTINRQGVK